MGKKDIDIMSLVSKKLDDKKKNKIILKRKLKFLTDLFAIVK